MAGTSVQTLKNSTLNVKSYSCNIIDACSDSQTVNKSLSGLDNYFFTR